MDWGRQFSAEEVEGMSSDEYKQALSGAASVQRGRPESVMNRIQHTLGGGVWPHALEHVGDLTHRMMESGGRFGLEFVRPKVLSMHGALHHPYGFEREMGEQFAETKSFRAREYDRHDFPTLNAIRSMGREYSDAHFDVPVYHMPGYQARQAAVNLGDMKFDNVRRNLRALKSDTEHEEGYRELTNQQSSVIFLRGMRQRGLL